MQSSNKIISDTYITVHRVSNPMNFFTFQDIVTTNFCVSALDFYWYTEKKQNWEVENFYE